MKGGRKAFLQKGAKVTKGEAVKAGTNRRKRR